MGNHQQIVYENGKIFTSNPDLPYAEAMAIENGRIRWIGMLEESRKLSGERVDLEGRRVIPGFVEAHMHPLHLANAATQISCAAPLVESLVDLKEQVKARRNAQNAGDWIAGWGYDEGKLAEGRAPLAGDLDEVVSDSPVVLMRTCMHTVSVNSKALEIAGITKDTPDPPGGEIDRDECGMPTGILRESARELVLKKMPQPSLHEQAQQLSDLSPYLFQRGITSVTDMMALAEPADYLELYKEARARGFLQRVSLFYTWEELKRNPELAENHTDRNKPVHIGGIKLFADGTISGHTAWVEAPYLETGHTGMSTLSKEEFFEASSFAMKHDLQIAVHAMGEQAIGQIIEAFSEVPNWISDGPSVRFEHGALPTGPLLSETIWSGIAFVSQPVFLFAEIESYLKNLGTARTQQAYPLKSMLDAGIQVAISSDAPATAWADPVNPFVGIQSAVTRIAYNGADTGQSERISAEQAVELYTKAAAEVTRLQGVGQLKAGFCADFLVLEQDIFAVEPNKISDVEVEKTYFGGELVYQKHGN